MGFTYADAEIEAWLTRSAAVWRRASDAEYRACFDEWRAVFEPILSQQRPLKQGVRALRSMEEHLPIDCMLLRVPAYRYLPAATGGRAFAYCVQGLRFLDVPLLNQRDAIVADTALTFCCCYTHETGALAEPAFYWVENRSHV